MKSLPFRPLMITSLAFVAAFHLARLQQQPVQAKTPPVPVPLTQVAHSQGQADRFEGPRIQVAILLDTSNSMDGLIHQAKRQLWNIVKELSKAELEGKAPRFEVALYEYGNDGLSITKNYVRQIVPFSTDLDKVSEELNRLKTNGGEEYCGAVLSAGLKELEWSQRPGDMQAIFIAGNEPFDQGGVSFREACAQARQKGIVVNTIFCGNKLEGERTHWSDGAALAAGRFLCIDADRVVADAATPYDTKLAELNGKLNQTYVAFGQRAAEGKSRQAAADNAAAAEPAAAGYVASRAQAKASSSYSNEAWDMVDAKKKGTLKLESLKEEELPSELRAKSQGEREAYVEAKSQERDKIQQEIRDTGKLRDEFLAKEKAKDGPDASLEGAILTAIREQAKAQGFRFKD